MQKQKSTQQNTRWGRNVPSGGVSLWQEVKNIFARKVFHTTPQRVIRAMRHAITVVWRKSDRAIIEKHCGYLGGKPNPSQFIEALAEDVQWRLDKDI